MSQTIKNNVISRKSLTASGVQDDLTHYDRIGSQSGKLRFVPFCPEHLRALRLDKFASSIDAQNSKVIADPAWGVTLRDMGIAETAIIEGPLGRRVACCAGLLHQWRGRAQAWMLLGEIERAEWLALIRRMRLVIGGALNGSVRRIDTTVNFDWEPGRHLCELLGFKLEARLECYSPEGLDQIMYARVRPCAVSEECAKPIAVDADGPDDEIHCV